MENQQIEQLPRIKPVYYWLDSYWITDKEEADLMDEINAFGSLHGTAYFPVSATDGEIQYGVNALLEDIATRKAKQTEQPSAHATAQPTPRRNGTGVHNPALGKCETQHELGI